MGTTVVGTLWTGMTPNRKGASRFSSGAVNVTAIQAYVDGRGATTGSQPLRGVIYSDASSAPNKPLATSSAVTISAGRTAGWITLSFASTVRLTSGSYWLTLHAGGSSVVARFAATNVSKALRYSAGADTYSDGASDPFGTTGSDNRQMSIVAIGTPG
jgi:hypothetical protein